MQLWHRWEKQIHCHFTDMTTRNQVPKVTQLEEEPEMQRRKNAFYPALSWALSQLGPPKWMKPRLIRACYFLSQTSQSLHSRASLAWGLFHSLRAILLSVQSSSVTQLYLTLCDPMDHGIPGFPVHHQLLELTQTHVYCVGDTIQPSHPLSSPSPPAFNLSQHQGFFQWIGSLHQVAKVLEFQLQHQSFQWIFRSDFL